jgi:hypothetical protein
MGKRENKMSYSKIRYKKNCKPFCSLRGKRCKSHLRAYTTTGAGTITTINGRTRKCFGLHNPSGHRSSFVSATAIENDDNHYLIDDLMESKECKLVMSILGIPRIVAYVLARPFIEGTIFNSHPIPKGYAIVLMDRVKPGHRRSKLEYPGENGE